MAYKGNGSVPIVAFDFDGVVVTCSEGKCSTYPIVLDACGDKRIHELMDFMRSLGVAVGIWTCREGDHKKHMEAFLNRNGYTVDFINDTTQYAPYVYKSRKIYAHLYIDDRAYGWNDGPSDAVVIDILRYFLSHTLSGDRDSIFTYTEINRIIRAFLEKSPPEEWMKERIKHWKD